MNKKSIKDILQAPRGMRDFFSEEFIKRKNFYKIAEKISEKYGFSGIETPIMEHTKIFKKGVGEGTDIVDKEMYNLETTSGDKLTLRPEGTAAIMRSYIEHGMGSLPQPQMFYYSGPFFRHEKPQKGRYRQLYQFGLEIMGSKNPLYDVLIIQTGYEILKQTNKKIILGINSIGNKEERKEYILKLKEFYKENEDKLANSDKNKIESNTLRILDSKEEKTKLLNEKAPILLKNISDESKKYFNDVLEGLDNIGIPYEIVNSLVRGLDYYEHTVFEYITIDGNGTKTSALGGGGRYDGLSETLGHKKSIPSVGLGLGVDRIIENSTKQILEENNIKKIFFISLNRKSHIKAINIIKNIKNKNIKVYFNFSENNIKKQFEKAEKLNIQYLLIIGENEIKNNTIIIKDNKTKTQKEIEIGLLEYEIEKIKEN